MLATETLTTAPPTAVQGMAVSDKHCVFRSGSSWFSVPAVSVREIAIMPNLVRVPAGHASLAGICHLRSEFVPVISLSSLLDLDTVGLSGSHDKLIVIHGTGSQSSGNHTTGTWALCIAEAAGLVSSEKLGTPESRADEVDSLSVIGTLTFRDQIVRVLDPLALHRQVRCVLEDLWSQPMAMTGTQR